MTIKDLTYIQELYNSYNNNKTAEKMAAYMKNNFLFLGIPAPLRNNLNKILFTNLGKVNIEKLEPLILGLWELPEREYQYLAITILDKNIKNLKPSHTEFIISLIKTKSWWDSIDALAPKFIGEILYRFPETRNDYIDKWVNSNNIWINRTAILFQLKYKTETDFDLLKAIIESLKHKEEFFVKKAIGWALREYSKKEAQLVSSYIQDTNLQALSKKEGLKFILRNN